MLEIEVEEVVVEGLTLVARQLEVGLVGVNHGLGGIVEEVEEGANDEEASDEAAAAAAVVGVAAVDDDAASSSLHDAVAGDVVVAEHVVNVVVDAEDAVDAAAVEDVEHSGDVEDAFAFASAFVDASAYVLDGLASSFEQHSDAVLVAAFVADVEGPFVDAVEEAFLALDQDCSELFSFAVFALLWPLFYSQQRP